MFLRHWFGIVPLSLGLFVSTASGQVPTPPPNLDNWQDLCEITDPEILEVARSTCFLVNQNDLIENPDGSYRLLWEPMTKVCGDAVTCDQLCPNSKFYGEPKAVGPTPGRSGFLVAPDIVMTAAHFLPSDPNSWPNFCANQYYYVFDYARTNEGGSCVEVDFNRIPAENVYRCAEVYFDARVLPGDPYSPDAFFIRLETPAVGRQPLRVRRSGRAQSGDHLVSIGHPHGMSTKVSTQGGVWTNAHISDGQFLVEINLYGLFGLPGSSGSVIYNLDEHRVEMWVRTNGAISLDPGVGDCKVIGLSGIDSQNPSSLAHWPQMSPYIPQNGLPLVGPLDDVEHRCSTSGTCKNQTNQFTVSVPANAPGPVTFSLEVAPVSSGPVFPLQLGFGSPNGPSVMILAPGQSAQVVSKASFIAAAPGVYPRRVYIHDLTNGVTDSFTHFFTIETSKIEVTPTTSAVVENRIHPPYGPGRTYTVKNISTQPLTVRISSPDFWISANGVGAPDPQHGVEVYYNLAAAGNPNNSVDVYITAGPLGQLLPPTGGTDYGYVYFTNISDSYPGNGSTIRLVSFTHGAVRVVTEAPEPVPDGDPRGIYIPIQVDEDFCLDGITASLHLRESDCSQLFIEIISPGDESETLWDHQPGNFSTLNFNYPPNFETFHLDNPRGMWLLHIIDDVPGFSHIAPILDFTFRAFQNDPCE